MPDRAPAGGAAGAARDGQFLSRPVDYRSLRIVLTTLLIGDVRADLHVLASELQILLDEAERSAERERWDDRIIARWAEFEAAMRDSKRPSG
ncbi:hypothetical protein WDZ92_38210 [Nostoc sp. NIES-2111]